MEPEVIQEETSDFADKDWDDRFNEWVGVLTEPYKTPEPTVIGRVFLLGSDGLYAGKPFEYKESPTMLPVVSAKVLSEDDILNVISIDMSSPEPGRQWLDPIALKEVVSDDELDRLLDGDQT